MTTAIENRIRRQQAGMIATVLLTLTMSGFAQISSSPITANVSAPPRIRRIVLVSIADRRLAVIEDGNVLAYFSVAVGAPVSPSPTGEFEIVNRVADPAYYHDGVVTAASEKSPVGTRWIGLNLKGYGIHGTNAPLSHWAGGFAWMHPAEESGCGASLLDAARGRCGGDSRETRRGNCRHLWRRT